MRRDDGGADWRASALCCVVLARIAGVAVVLLLCATGAARAGGAASAGWLQWTSPPGTDACLGPDLFASKVERSLGHSATDAASDAHMRVAVRIEQVAGVAPGAPPRWWGEIRVQSRDGAVHGSRSFSREGASCEPLADALALATALVLSGDASETLPLRPPDGAGAGETGGPPGLTTSHSVAPPASDGPTVPPIRDDTRPPATPVESAHLEAESRTGAPRSWQVGVDAALAFGIGILPEPSLGLRASLFLQLGGGTKIFVAGSAWSKQTSVTGADQGATLTLATLGLGVCPWQTGWGAWALRTCARGDVGRLEARGFGFTRSLGQDRLTADAAVAGEVQRRIVGPLYAGVAAELVVPLIRDRIAYSGSSGEVGTIFRPAPLAGVGTFRLGCVF